LKEAWPKFDPAAIRQDTVTIVIQINGKLRSKVEVATDTPEEGLKKIVLKDEKVSAQLEGGEPKRIIVVPNKLVNVVI
jgi:leucyl-tRNA synthetase